MTTQIISTTNALWTRGKKTKGLKAKAMASIFADLSIASKFLVNTLEGEEAVSATSMFCMGETGDAWQQTPAALLKKYNIDSVDADGWLLCTPKPENEVEFFELTQDLEGAAPGLYIQGTWGKDIEGVGKNLQRIYVGDFVCRQPHDHSDQWVVRRQLFKNSYTEI